jgi:hypothetical protein
MDTTSFAMEKSHGTGTPSCNITISWDSTISWKTTLSWNNTSHGTTYLMEQHLSWNNTSHGTTHLMEQHISWRREQLSHRTPLSHWNTTLMEHHSHGKHLHYLMGHQSVAEQLQSLHSLTHFRRTLSLVWNSAMTNIQHDTFNHNRASVILESHKFSCGTPLSWNTTVSKNTSNPSLNCYR